MKVSIWVLTLFGLTSIVWVRMHYSLDVVLALYFTVTVWSSYHRIANDVRIGHRFSAVWIFDALIVYPFIEWVETPDKVLGHDDEEDHAPEEESKSSKRASSSPPPAFDLPPPHRTGTRRPSVLSPSRRRYNFRSRSRSRTSRRRGAS